MAGAEVEAEAAEVADDTRFHDVQHREITVRQRQGGSISRLRTFRSWDKAYCKPTCSVVCFVRPREKYHSKIASLEYAPPTLVLAI